MFQLPPKLICCLLIHLRHGGQIPSYDLHVVCLLLLDDVNLPFEYLLFGACSGVPVKNSSSLDGWGG